MSKKLKIGVICGGISNERDVSLKSGQQVFENLSETKYDKVLIEISNSGEWVLKDSGNNLVIIGPKNDLSNFDMCFVALHGQFGEDGRIQSIFDLAGVPYSGSGVLASALGMNKVMASRLVSTLGIKTPGMVTLYGKDDIAKKEISFPCVVKPNESGSSVGISIVKTNDDLEEAIQKAFREDKMVLIEEYISGREITCGVLGNASGGELEALPPVEIITNSEFFDYDAKYQSEATQEICPADLSLEDTKQIQKLVKEIHREFGCDGLTRSDFILKDGEFYFLEINTLPGLTKESICPKEAKVAGMTFPDFLDRQIQLALNK